MKKVFSILLLMALMFDISGHIIIFKKLQKDIHRKIKRAVFEQIPFSQLEVIENELGDSNPTIIWIHSKEFKLNGKMYDILKRDTVGNIENLYCVWDKDEENLITKYSSLISGKIRDFESKYSSIPIFTIDTLFFRITEQIRPVLIIYCFHSLSSSLLIGFTNNSEPPPKFLS